MVTTNEREATPACTVCRVPLPKPEGPQTSYRNRRVLRSVCPWCDLLKRQIAAAHEGDRATHPLSPELAAEREARIRLYRRRAKKKLPLFTGRRSTT